jgi:hypothetical protein
MPSGVNMFYVSYFRKGYWKLLGKKKKLEEENSKTKEKGKDEESKKNTKTKKGTKKEVSNEHHHHTNRNCFFNKMKRVFYLYINNKTTMCSKEDILE